MKAHQAEILKAKEQELKDAANNDKANEESKGVNGAAGGTPGATAGGAQAGNAS